MEGVLGRESCGKQNTELFIDSVKSFFLIVMLIERRTCFAVIHKKQFLKTSCCYHHYFGLWTISIFGVAGWNQTLAGSKSKKTHAQSSLEPAR